ncbi:MAG: hypothetical protein WBW04_05240 [Nitrolancea sp.]
MQRDDATSTPVPGLSWQELSEARPDLTDAGRQLFYQVGVGLAFMSTVRPDGGPRLHPICPVIASTGLYAFIIPSPKLNDLRRDARYALHSFPTDDNEDAFYITGRAVEIHEHELRTTLTRQFRDERSTMEFSDDHLNPQALIEFFVDRCLVTRTDGFGDALPRHTIWHAG